MELNLTGVVARSKQHSRVFPLTGGELLLHEDTEMLLTKPAAKRSFGLVFVMWHFVRREQPLRCSKTCFMRAKEKKN